MEIPVHNHRKYQLKINQVILSRKLLTAIDVFKGCLDMWLLALPVLKYQKINVKKYDFFISRNKLR